MLKTAVQLSSLSSGGTHLQCSARGSRKSGNDKELRRLYDAAIQHYRALNAAKADSFEILLTMILQQKLDEWSRHG